MLNHLKRRVYRIVSSHRSLWHDYGYWAAHRLRGFNPKWRLAPRLRWASVEAGRAVLGGKLYYVGGYHTLDRVSQSIEIFDLKTHKWLEPVPIPPGVAQTHAGVVDDGVRHIFIVGGQVGPRCSPCVSDVYVFDVVSGEWRQLPGLPQGRYAPSTAFVQSRIHVIGGSCEDRNTPSSDHWSLGVENGTTQETSWRREIGSPRAGTHRACCAVGDRLYLLGGQEGDVKPVKGDSTFRCDWETPEETVYGDVHSYCVESKLWRKQASVPTPVSHCEFCLVQKSGKILLIGGQYKVGAYSAKIQIYDCDNDAWSVEGEFPYPIKGNVAVSHGDWLYSFGGQKTYLPRIQKSGAVLRSGWRARIRV